LFVVVDNPRSTNGSFNETIEINNHDNITVSAGAWHIFYGFVGSDTELFLADATRDIITNWTFSSFSSGNLYAADSESSISWLNLEAIGRDDGGSPSSGDFAEIDTALSMTGFNDSVYNDYTTGGTPNDVDTFTVFSQTISNVPIVNSTNNSNFQTGILWDTVDDGGDGEYDGSDLEDLVFVTKLNQDALGAYGTYDYEFRVPARLREYNTTNVYSVAFYVEIDS
jgi:hypothetical protein